MNGLSDPSPPPAAAGTPPQTPASAPAASGQQAAPRLALFRLGGRLCGITAAFCKQFVQLEAVTRVPLAPAHLLGVTQLRGRILPVLDPSLLPGLPPLPEPAAPTTPTAPPAPAASSGMQALVVTATGLDSALAALRVSEIVGFERPTASGPAGAASPAAASAAARPLWRGEEVTVLDVAVLFAFLRPASPDAASGSRGAPAVSRGEEAHGHEKA
jgi:purine-binding chemotaxis protein CheW